MQEDQELQIKIEKAARLIKDADAILVMAGAGMGVDSGLPDFRGDEGFWAAYPALARAGLDFREIATPDQFVEHPRRAWGFYGHRLNMYRNTTPHEGFKILKGWCESKPGGYFVYTSNVDGQFQKAGFSESKIAECHGTIHRLQCLRNCKGRTWSSYCEEPEIDEENCLLTSDIPKCPACGGVARPNILMFDDMMWDSERSTGQTMSFRTWLEHKIEKDVNTVVIELGAGTGIPRLRMLADQLPMPLVRINLRESEVSHRKADSVGLPMGALNALSMLEG